LLGAPRMYPLHPTPQISGILGVNQDLGGGCEA
jgi:hypothetical protein